MQGILLIYSFCFLGFLSQTQSIHRIAGEEKEQPLSFLPLSSNHEHPDIYLQSSIWEDYIVLLIAAHENYQNATLWDLSTSEN